MLAAMGLETVEELFAAVPQAVRMQRSLRIPAPLAEVDHLARFAELAAKNKQGYRTFLGAGCYPHQTPVVVEHLIQRGEFLTSYTPYQAEAAQGTLQAIFEFQTLIAMLSGMEISNASLYDGASATAEAVLMACRLREGRTRICLAQSLHPHYQEVVRSYLRPHAIELVSVGFHARSGQVDPSALESVLDPKTVCLVVQQPNFFGGIEDLQSLAQRVQAAGALFVSVVNEPHALSVLRSPGDCGADLVAGEAQGFGLPPYFGGPGLGFLAAREADKRQLPGRLAGATQDTAGRRGFVLTLATREQHIRRAKATSNICTNQNLMLIAASIYLALHGAKGLREVAQQNLSLTAWFLEQLAALPGYERVFSTPCFNELTLRCPRPAQEIVRACLAHGVVPGVDLGRWHKAWDEWLLICFTEQHTRSDVEALIHALAQAGQQDPLAKAAQ